MIQLPPTPAKVIEDLNKTEAATIVAKPILRLCNFCKDNHHTHCPSAALNPKDQRLVICKCGCSVKCRRCRTSFTSRGVEEGGINLETRVCTDVEACAEVVLKVTDNPLRRTIEECRAAGRQARTEAKTARTDPRPPSAPREPTETPSRAPREPRPPREPRVAKVATGSCLCCGGETRGGLFLPGHDSKLLTRLAAEVAGGKARADALRELPTPALQEKLNKRLAAAAAKTKKKETV